MNRQFKTTVIIFAFTVKAISQTYISEDTYSIMNENNLLFEQLNGKKSDEIIDILSVAISDPNININTETDVYLKSLSGSIKSLVLNNYDDGINELKEAFILAKPWIWNYFKTI